jgi:propanediol utilization protein
MSIIERVRILDPLQNQKQIDISITEEFELGIKEPIRPYGDLEGRPGITLQGQMGTCDVLLRIICAFRHIHVAPEDSLSFNLKTVTLSQQQWKENER